MTLTDETLRAYIESAKNATEGPWTNAKSALVYLLPDGDAICEALHIEGEFRTHIYNADFIAASRTIGPAAAEEVLRLREALIEARTWHEASDKAISKQPNASQGANRWNRLQHQEQIEMINKALKEANDE